MSASRSSSAHGAAVYADVSNFPGTTVEISSGKIGEDVLLDTPGVYGVSSFNDEERVARDVILTANVAVNVVDATHLERDLFLTLQLVDMGIPMVVALNFCDEAQSLGIRIDARKLEDQLGVPVIPTAAVKNSGIKELFAALPLARPGLCHPEVDQAVTKLLDRIDTRPEALMVLEGDEVVAERHGVNPENDRERVYLLRRQKANEIVAATVTRPEKSARLRDLLGRLCLHPASGLLILLAVLWGCYELIGVWVAGDIVGLTEETIMQGHWEPWIRGLVDPLVLAKLGSSGRSSLASLAC